MNDESSVSPAKELARKEPAPDTRDRVLDVAERLFADRGLDAVSIRDITGAAGANLGAINYYFGTKDGLIVAVFDRRMTPLTEKRLHMLDALEAAAGDCPPPLEAVLDALFRPAIEIAMDASQGGITFSKLVARCLMEPNPAMEKALSSHIERVVTRFDAALLRAMPQLTPGDVFWRLHLLVGALHHSLMLMGRPLPGWKCLQMDAETYVKRFLAFATAAFKAPVT